MLKRITEKLSWRNGLLVVGGLLIVAFFAYILFKILVPHAGSPVIIADINTADSIVIHSDSVVKPVLYSHVPDLSELSVKDRKKRFIHLMLPAILLAQEKIAVERIQVEQLLENAKEQGFSSEDSVKLNRFLEKFNAQNERDLLNRLHPHPLSIILAQAAIESGWGSSRFFKEANNAFGIWSYNSNEPRIVAGESRGEDAIFLRSYDTLFESVYDYLLVVARGHAYRDFRNIRRKSQNPYRLIWFLSNYSEKRLGYVSSLRTIIEFNDFIQYDHYRLEKIDRNDENWKKLLDS
ncbi:glucosaminidase domain-containing protein [Marinilabilia salmonicolor]|uniref:Bax protein n=1 Tax=Marinilabilia salmonicolor TaxID=989 RepID=A0A368UJS1_9BACT|nr:glucosaminidase domain-containing protein [Marinilabilia salmonicolor]RCW28918.1 Bax protein [Marinilabilia salmonicolor]